MKIRLLLIISISGVFNAFSQTLNTAQLQFQALKYGIFVSFMPYSGVSPINANATGVWESTVNNFNVTKFVADIQETGAGYVLFPTGQTSGFYTAPNKVYTNITHTTNGQYVSSRDLVLDVAKALNAVGIKTLVYMAAEGPTAAPAAIKNAFPITTDQAPLATRKTLNSMVGEWSRKWGDNVIGWWFDGCFVDGYSNAAYGEQNSQLLCDSAKAGNSNSMVALNAAVQNFTFKSVGQDYIAGEENWLHRYPYNSNPLIFKNKAMLWQVISFLGSSWGAFDANKYTDDQLVKYIMDVNNRGGLVTMDLGINADGSLNATQKAKFANVKSIIRGGNPALTYSNLALFKPVYYMTNNSAGYELGFNGAVYEHFATYGVDGINTASSKLAMSGGEWTWSYVIDLNQVTDFDLVKLCMDASNFATNYTLLYSNDKLSWKAIGTYTSNAGGSFIDHNFALVNARYLRVRGNKPDRPNQTGNGLSIKEIEVYNTTTSASEITKHSGLLVFIDKTNSKLHIKSDSKAIGNLKIFNANGMEVYSVSNVNTELIIPTNLIGNSGTYIIQTTIGNQKFII